MAQKNNETFVPGASLRRTLNIGNFESLVVELPLMSDQYGSMPLAIAETQLLINQTLIEWVNIIGAGNALNIGKGGVDRLNSENDIIKSQISAIKDSTHSL